MAIIELPTTKSFRVVGTPIPQGSMSGFNRGGRVIITSSNPKLKDWRKLVKEEAEKNLPAFPLDGDLDVFYIFYVARPKSISRAKRLKPNVKPDLDKLVRSVNDSLTDSQFIADDARIVEIHATKLYADENEPEGVWISVGEQ